MAYRTPNSSLENQKCRIAKRKFGRSLFVLRLLVREAFPCPVSLSANLALESHAPRYIRRKLSELVSNHILRDSHIMVYLAVVHLEDKAYEIGKYSGCSCLGLDWRYSLARLWPNNWKSENVSNGTMGSSEL